MPFPTLTRPFLPHRCVFQPRGRPPSPTLGVLPGVHQPGRPLCELRRDCPRDRCHGQPPQHVPRLGSNWSCSCQPTATLDLSRICDLYVSLQQHWILNPLSEARDRTPVLMDAGRAVPPEVWQPHQPPRSRGGPCPSSLRAALRTELPWPWLSEPWVGRATSSTHTALLAMAQRFRQNRSELMTTWTCGSMTGGGGAQPCPWIPGSRCCGRPDRRHCLQLLLQGSARRCWPGASAGSPSCTWRPLSRPLALDRHGGGLPTGV
ncbi:uncharacterized protein LOC100620498 isoform X7 [Sus scrofa]|uniref:uncharacterized protein LOC100620498 isoform X7 n=1 Tax=Sus scrofa TaxID=9823 RepID=UPI000A2B4834|nr:uncharacterized protein LOC100620498 isoform X7 [Sus scrofa]